MTIEERIVKIQDAFQVGKSEGDLKGIVPIYSFETELPKELISVAFEGCSMAIALKSIKNRDSLIDWHLFVSTKGKNFLSQMHVGLGWALAELKLPVEQYLISIDPKWQLRVLDGFGYYCGLFRRREAIRSMLFPSEIPNTSFSGYNQGIGRVLYYISQGESERLTRNVALFSEDRHGDLWRGIGIAATFVGGLSDDAIKCFVHAAGKHENDFKIGVVLANNSMLKAEALTSTSTPSSAFLLSDCERIIQTVTLAEEKHHASIDAFLEALSS